MIGKRFTRYAASVAAAIGLAFLLPSLTGPSAASAAEIRVMSTVALSATLDELKPGFETATGHKVTMVSSTAEMESALRSHTTTVPRVIVRPVEAAPRPYLDAAE